MALVGADGRFLRVNRALRELLGRAEADLLAGTLAAIHHPADRAAVAGYGARVLAGELDGYEAVGRVLPAHGHALWVHLYASLVRDPQGRPGHLVVQLIDLTARRPAEAERAELIRAQAARAEAEAGERRHRSLAEAIPRIVWNLMKNAVKFTPEGGRVRVGTRNLDGPDGTPRLVVEVADSGIGIDPEALPRIFNAFEQGEVTAHRQYGGLGLGLAIGRFVAEAHGGRLAAASPGVGRGASFTLDLAAVAPPQRPGRRPARPAEAAPPARPLRILLVEDDQPSLRVLARLLQQRGCEVTTAISVASALAAGGRGDFDLLVSDIGLPDGTGLDLMRRLSRVRPVRGIALSGFGLDADLQRSPDAGFLAHLTKPVNFASLEAAIRQVAIGGEAAGPG